MIRQFHLTGCIMDALTLRRLEQYTGYLFASHAHSTWVAPQAPTPYATRRTLAEKSMVTWLIPMDGMAVSVKVEEEGKAVTSWMQKDIVKPLIGITALTLDPMCMLVYLDAEKGKGVLFVQDSIVGFAPPFDTVAAEVIRKL